MASRYEMCEANAQVCEHLAQLVKEPQAREAYLHCAETWRQMARELEPDDDHQATAS
jgi:hypothetical protein